MSSQPSTPLAANKNQPDPDRHCFTFEAQTSQRLDKFLVDCLPDFSRSRIQALIEAGLVTINGKLPRKAGQMLDKQTEVCVEIPPPQPSHLTPEKIPLDIVYEDQDLVVVNKPAGMVVHPAAGHGSGTLVHAALAHIPDLQGIGGEQRPGVVHRLDKNTSGLILIAKNDSAHRWLQDQFRLHKVSKTYLALVDGHPPTPTGHIEAAIGRDLKNRKKMAIVAIEKGRQAASEYHTLETFPEHALLEVHPITGRTHQIRLHLAFLGCPVAGDNIYGRHHSTIPLERHFLHATRLEIRLKNQTTPCIFEAPLPPELVHLLDKLRHQTY